MERNIKEINKKFKNVYIKFKDGVYTVIEKDEEFSILDEFSTIEQAVRSAKSHEITIGLCKKEIEIESEYGHDFGEILDDIRIEYIFGNIYTKAELTKKFTKLVSVWEESRKHHIKEKEKGD